jgi:hypothetical protein
MTWASSKQIDDPIATRRPGANGRLVLGLGLASFALGCDPGQTLWSDVPQSEIAPPAPVDDQNQLPSYVAQCEAVLGPVPEISCDPADPAPGTNVTKIPVLVGGRLLGFDGQGSAEDEALLAKRASEGRYECDFPSIGGDFACTVGSTLVQYQSPDNPNVQWVGLCRGVGRDNPGYDRFIGNGLIGANVKTGEMCFFFGLNPEPDAAYELPRLTSDASSEALSPWVAPKEMPGSCLSCHPNNDPWIFTPWLMPPYMREVLSRPEYGLELPDGVALDDVLAARHIAPTPATLQTMLPPPLPDGRTAWTEEEILDDNGAVLRRQYRAVGSSYVHNEALGQVKPRTGLQPESWKINFRDRLKLQPSETMCSAPCHSTGNEHWHALAMDSIAAEKYSQYMVPDETLRELTWMPGAPDGGSVGDTDSYTVDAISECPIPRQVAEPPRAMARCDEQGASVELLWLYPNTFGDVPGRDDIRFDVAITAQEEPLGISPQSPLEGVPIEEAADRTVVRDVAPSEEGAYRIAIPSPQAAGTVHVHVQPKRYCFEEPDRRPFAHAPPARITVELACE